MDQVMVDQHSSAAPDDAILQFGLMGLYDNRLWYHRLIPLSDVAETKVEADATY